MWSTLCCKMIVSQPMGMGKGERWEGRFGVGWSGSRMVGWSGSRLVQ